ncbi:MAG: hypothetical protein WB497_04065, partial [Pseudolabrys sp.]
TWQLRRECVRAGKPSPRDLELDVSQCRFSSAGTNKICSSDLRRDKAMYTLSRIGFYARYPHGFFRCSIEGWWSPPI